MKEPKEGRKAAEDTSNRALEATALVKHEH